MEELLQIHSNIEDREFGKYTVSDIVALNEKVFTYDNPVTYTLFLEYNKGKLTDEEVFLTNEIISKLKRNRNVINKLNLEYMERHLKQDIAGNYIDDNGTK